jgi:hypothetical protein
MNTKRMVALAVAILSFESVVGAIRGIVCGRIAYPKLALN